MILHEEITSSRADSGSVVGSAGTRFASSINRHVSLKRKLLWGWTRSVRVEFRISLLLEIMAKHEDAGREADIEGEVVDVVCLAPALAISGFQLQGFIFSEINPRK